MISEGLHKKAFQPEVPSSLPRASCVRVNGKSCAFNRACRSSAAPMIPHNQSRTTPTSDDLQRTPYSSHCECSASAPCPCTGARQSANPPPRKMKPPPGDFSSDASSSTIQRRRLRRAAHTRGRRVGAHLLHTPNVVFPGPSSLESARCSKLPRHTRRPALST